jgi:hypothetical protein
MTFKPLERPLLRFQEAIVFQDYLIVPIGERYRVFDPDGLALVKEPDTVAAAQDLIVDAVIRDILQSQIGYWRETGVISETQAELMQQAIHQLV